MEVQVGKNLIRVDGPANNVGAGGVLVHREVLAVGDSVFFFSSRRRHTRCSRDWSSDVCSSDLGGCNDESERYHQARAHWGSCGWRIVVLLRCNIALYLDTVPIRRGQAGNGRILASRWLPSVLDLEGAAENPDDLSFRVKSEILSATMTML